MRYAKFLLAAILGFCGVTAQATTPAWVQSAYSGGTGVTTVSVSFSSSTTPGHAILVFVHSYLISTLPTSVMDTQSNHFYYVTSQFQNQIPESILSIYVASNIAGGADTVTVDFASNNPAVGIEEFSGADANYPVDGSTTSWCDSCSSLTNYLSNPSGDLLVSAGGTGSYTPPTASGYTARIQVTSSYIPLYTWDGTGQSIDMNQGTTQNLFIFVSVSLRPAAPSVGFLQSAAAYAASASSLAAALPYNATAGSLLVATVSTQAAATPSSVSGCSATWIRMAIPNDSDVFVYYAMNAAGGACTFTASFGSGEQINVTLSEYKGAATTYAVEIYQATGRSGAPSTAAGTFGTNDIVFGVVNDQNSPSTQFAMSSGFTARAFVSNYHENISTATFDNVGAAATYTSAPTLYNGSSNASQILIAFRSVLPAIGRLQYTDFNATGTVSYTFANRAGDLLIAECENGTYQAPADGNGNTWLVLPVLLTSDSTNAYFPWYVPSANAGSDTVTCPATSSGGQLWEYTGLSGASPLGASTNYFTQAATYSIPTGTAAVNSTSVLFSIATVMETSLTPATLTPTSGFIPVTYTGGGNAVVDSVQQWDEVVSAGSYSNTVTASQNLYFPQGYILAFESAPVLVPYLRQHTRVGQGAGPDGSATAVTPAAVHAGDLIVAVVTNQTVSAGPGTMSDNQFNHYNVIAGGSALDKLTVYWTIASATGVLSTTNTSNNCINVTDFSVPSTPAVDQSNYQTDLGGGTSIADGGVTIAAPNELVASIGYIDSDNYRLYLSSFSTGWSGEVFGCGGHETAAWLAFRPQVAAGSYGNTWAWTNSSPIAAAIASFKFGSGGGPPSQGQIISEAKELKQFDQTR